MECENDFMTTDYTLKFHAKCRGNRFLVKIPGEVLVDAFDGSDLVNIYRKNSTVIQTIILNKYKQIEGKSENFTINIDQTDIPPRR